MISNQNIYYANLIPFSNDTKDTGSVSFLSLPHLVWTDSFVLSLFYIHIFEKSDRDRYSSWFSGVLTITDVQMYTITILFNYFFLLRLLKWTWAYVTQPGHRTIVLFSKCHGTRTVTCRNCIWIVNFYL